MNNIGGYLPSCSFSRILSTISDWSPLIFFLILDYLVKHINYYTIINNQLPVRKTRFLENFTAYLPLDGPFQKCHYYKSDSSCGSIVAKNKNLSINQKLKNYKNGI